MRERDELSLDREFERSLARLRPAADGLDVAELAFRAGRRSAKSRRVWPALAGLLAATQALTLALWPGGPAPSGDTPRVRRPPAARAPGPPPPGELSYAALRNSLGDGATRTVPPEPYSGGPPGRPPLTVRSELSLNDFD